MYYPNKAASRTRSASDCDLLPTPNLELLGAARKAKGSLVRIMLANNTGMRTGYLAGRYPGKIGHLVSPGAERGPFDFPDWKYSLDNGAFGPKGFQVEPWLKLLEWAKLSGQSPSWVLVPDVVGDRAGTLDRWTQYAPVAARYRWPLAFAVQDGMTERDVPPSAEVVFVGGSTFWKWRTVASWCKAFHRVHVGRVNTYRRLWECHDAGAESTDGTGFMRGDQRQYRGLCTYLAESTGEAKRSEQPNLWEEVRAVHIY